MPRHLKYCILFFITLQVHQTPAQGHKYLLLEKGASRKKIRIYPGSDIRLRFHGDDRFYLQQIKDLSEKFIFFENAVVKVTEVAEIDITNHKQGSNLFVDLGKKLPIAGTGYFLIDNFNRTVVMNQPFNIDEKVVRTSSIMVAAGLIFIFTDKKTFKVRGRNRLRVVNLIPE